MEHAGVHELAAPADLLVVIDLLEHLGVGIFSLLALDIGDNVDNLEVLLRKLGTSRSDVGKLNTKRLVTHISLLMRDNLDLNGCLRLTSFESDSTVGLFEISARRGSVLRGVKGNCCVVDRNAAIGAVLTDELDLGVLLSGESLNNSLSLFKGNVARLVVIDDSNARVRVLARKLLVVVCIVQLKEEVSIGVPVIVVLDLDDDSLIALAVGEVDNLVNGLIILLFLGLTLHSGDADLGCFTRLVVHDNLNGSRSFRHGVMEASKAEVIVQANLIHGSNSCVLQSDLLTLLDGNFALAAGTASNTLAVL